MKQRILTTDNCCRELSSQERASHLENLQTLAAKPLGKLNLDEHPNLLIFPQGFDIHGDDIGKQHILTMESDKLVTGNVMGFVGYRDTQIRISSRFIQQDNHDYFLHYMLQRVFAINIFNLKYDSDTESIFDFLIYLFPSFLKRAIRQGVYKEYQTRRYNDANVRGRIDVGQHIRQNVPFAGNVAYMTREFAIDNAVTQLVRHTIEYISNHPYCGGILSNDEETKEAIVQIRQATPTYNRNERRQVLNKNLRPVRHPYFNEYRNLQRLCLQILRHEEMKYGHDDEQIYGILFDGAWLWEEYLNTFLKDLGLEHPRNKVGQGRKNLFTDNTGCYYPDFHNQHMVLDAKYKGYADWSHIQNADLYQVISYMHVLNVNLGGFLVPVEWRDNRLPVKILKGQGGTLFVEGLNPKTEASCYTDYVYYMYKEEERMRTGLRDMLSD